MPEMDDVRAALGYIARERTEIEKAWERDRAVRERESIEIQKTWEREQKNLELERARAQREWTETQEQRKKEETLQRETRARQAAEPAPERFSGHTGGMLERVMAGGLVKQFAGLRYQFTKISRNIEFEDPRTGVHMLIDALLENGDCAMVVAVRPALTGDDITGHIERLRKLRKYSDARNDRQRFYGALAAGVISEDMKTSALKQGLYIIEFSGETVTVIPPLVEPAVF
jgi:hypothetical protein